MNIFTDEQWEEVRGDYPADLWNRCDQGLLQPLIDQALGAQTDEFISELEVTDGGYEVEVAPFNSQGWAALFVGSQFVSLIAAAWLVPA